MVNYAYDSFSSHINCIALTHDMKYFYFKPFNKDALFRIETRYLVDPSLNDDDLRALVESFPGVGITHGLIADAIGNVYITTCVSYSVSYITLDVMIHTLVQVRRLISLVSSGID